MNMIRAAGRVVFSLVAVVDGEVVGHVLFSPVTLGPQIAGARWVAMGPLGVTPKRQGQGVGSRLINEGVERCRAAGHDGIVLLGAPDYYSRLGFVPAREYNLTSDYGDGPEFQALGLRGSAPLPTRHRAIYSPEFEMAGPGVPSDHILD